MLRNEIEAVLERDGRGLEVDFVDGALHDYPDRLRAELQERIDATPGDCDVYLLLRGAAATARWASRAATTAWCSPPPTTASRCSWARARRYLEEHGAQPGTYYYTRGWVDFIDDPYKEYLNILPKYGEEKSARVARLIMEHYTRLAVIETPDVPGLEDKMEYLETVRRFYDLPLEKLTGSLRFLEKLVAGPHDEEFILVEPGDELEESRFWALSSV